MKLIAFTRTAVKNLLHLFYPTLCAGCQTMMQGDEEGLCSTCRMQLPYIIAEADQQALLNKFGGRVQIDYLYSYIYFTKGGMAQRLIHQLKYKGKRTLGLQLGRWYGQELAKVNGLPMLADLLVPVPIHPRRRQQRGYNQSEWIAEGLSEQMAIVSRPDVLERTQFISSQTRKNRLDRWQNVASMFRVSNPDEVRGRHVILIDDVLTTGATLEACATELRQAGAATVGIITIATTR